MTALSSALEEITEVPGKSGAIKLTEITTYMGPPGCGKTQTVSNLIRNCIEDGIPPERIACVSFTRKAAAESRERVCRDWGIEEDSLTNFQTLHSIAFRDGGFTTRDVIRPSDLAEIGDQTGLIFGKSKSNRAESDFDQVGLAEGDQLLGVYYLARNKRMSLEETFRKHAHPDMSWSVLKRLVDAYVDFKRVRGKIDFTDMIEEFVARGIPLDIDALFVDEAQDLSTLQWEMVNVLKASPRTIVFVGDDDQAIMDFQGADVQAFQNASSKKIVLHQSYRVPRLIWKEAQTIVRRIEGREPKVWNPTDQEGRTQWHQNILDVPLHSGNWTIMARTNRLVSAYAKSLREEGFVYSRKGHPSIAPKTYDAMMDWETWTKGEPLSGPQIRNVYSYMNNAYEKGYGPRSKNLQALTEDDLITMDEAMGTLGLLRDKELRWHEALDKIDLETKTYVLNALKRGENVKHPRINLSTIHGMKGGECDNILVVPDLSYAAAGKLKRGGNVEHRVFYVAVTRAKKELHVMAPMTNQYYDL